MPKSSNLEVMFNRCRAYKTNGGTRYGDDFTYSDLAVVVSFLDGIFKPASNNSFHVNTRDIASQLQLDFVDVEAAFQTYSDKGLVSMVWEGTYRIEKPVLEFLQRQVLTDDALPHPVIKHINGVSGALQALINYRLADYRIRLADTKAVTARESSAEMK